MVVLNQDGIRWFRPGMAFGVYLFGYGFVRLLLERIRTDSLYIGPLPAAYWLSFALMIVGVVVVMLRRATAQNSP